MVLSKLYTHTCEHTHTHTSTRVFECTEWGVEREREGERFINCLFSKMFLQDNVNAYWWRASFTNRCQATPVCFLDSVANGSLLRDTLARGCLSELLPILSWWTENYISVLQERFMFWIANSQTSSSRVLVKGLPNNNTMIMEITI